MGIYDSEETITLKTQKPLKIKRLSDVDPARLTLASLGVNSSMLLYTLRAQVHRFILKQKKLFYKNFFCDTQLCP